MSERMDHTTKGKLLEQQSAEERTAFAAFKQTYLARVPYPERPAKLDFKNLGFQFYLYLVQAISSIALAAMRTWEAFYRVGMLANHGARYALLEAWLAVLVVEVGMVSYAASNANKRYHQKEDLRRMEAQEIGSVYVRSRKVETRGFVLGLGLVILLLLSTAAGLDQAVRAINNVSQEFLQVLSYSLNVAIGVGVSVIAFIGGEILGQQLAIVTADFDDLAESYEADVALYQKELEDAWSRSDERRVIRADVRQAAKQTSSSVEFGYGSVTNNFRTNGELRRPPKQTERVFQYMDQIYETEGRVPTFSEVMEVLAIAKATASESRSRWLQERGIGDG